MELEESGWWAREGVGGRRSVLGRQPWSARLELAGKLVAHPKARRPAPCKA